jgi:hypothetical protein
MKNFSRRKFVGTAMMSGLGAAALARQPNVPGITPENDEVPEITGSGNADSEAGKKSKAIEQPDPDLETMRPFRKKQLITVTVGQDEGDFRGNDDKILQAAVDYTAGLGGGTIRILPGTYTMRNALFPRSGITIRGSGDKTVLKKSRTVNSLIVRESDWFEYAVRVENPEGFTEGCGVALSSDNKKSVDIKLYTVTAIREDLLFLDQLTGSNFWMTEGARARTLFSVIHGINADDVNISDLVLDGNRDENDNIDNDYASALYTIYCKRWNIRNVVAREYNSDGFSIQASEDMLLEDCIAVNNTDYGFHPGSGTQRPVFRRCTARGNRQGFFWCWSACFGKAEECVSEGNLWYGFNFGHRDTDNIVRNCLVENNGRIGILFRKEENEFRSPDRNIIENCRIRNNGGSEQQGTGIDIQWRVSDITIRNCAIENSKEGTQKVGIRISPEAQRILLEGNTFGGDQVRVEDQRSKN